LLSKRGTPGCRRGGEGTGGGGEKKKKRREKRHGKDMEKKRRREKAKRRREREREKGGGEREREEDRLVSTLAPRHTVLSWGINFSRFMYVAAGGMASGKSFTAERISRRKIRAGRFGVLGLPPVSFSLSLCPSLRASLMF
jgi:hypothetical protein